MSIYQKVSYDDAPEAVRSTYDEVLREFELNNKDDIPNLFLYLGSNPDILSATWALIKAGVLNTKHIPDLLRELIIVELSRGQESAYCEALHFCNALKLSELEYAEISNILTGESKKSLPELYHVALDMVRKLVKTDCKYIATDITSLLDKGFSQEQVQEIVHVINTMNYIHSITVAADLPIDQSVIEFLRSKGYPMPKHWWNRRLAKGMPFGV